MMFKVILLYFLINLVFCTGCTIEPKYLGNSPSGEYRVVSENKVSPVEAISIAKPYLDKTFELRTQKREYISEKPPVDHITQKGEWYYLVRDNYPAKSVYFYMPHAVKVHVNTGEVIEPK